MECWGKALPGRLHSLVVEDILRATCLSRDPVLELNSCMTLSKSHDLSVSQFPHV